MPVTMVPSSADPRLIGDEEYLVLRAKKALTVDPHAAKAWMITAKTLYPNNFAVQFEAYNIVKSVKNVKEAAKYFETLLKQFQGDTDFWEEVEALTQALQTDCGEPDPTFLRTMFTNLSTDAQQQLLQVTADRSKDTMEHCRLLMLLLTRFPQAIVQHGPRLLDTLLTAEKHTPHQSAINCYRKLLVCELVPLMGSSKVAFDLPPRQLHRLLHKTIEFYLCCLITQNVCEPDPWGGLFMALHSLSRMLGWDLSGIFDQPWNRELFWQQLVDDYERLRLPLDSESKEVRQLVYCTSVFFLRCLHEYFSCIHSGERQLVLLESFVTAPSDWEVSDPPSKRRKADEASPLVTVDAPVTSAGGQSNNTTTGSGSTVSNLVQNSCPSSRERNAATTSVVVHLQAALRCWVMIQNTDAMKRGVEKLLQILGVDTWLTAFQQDMQLYRGEVDDLVSRLLQTENQESQLQGQGQSHSTLIKNLRLASAFYCSKQLPAAVDHALQSVVALGSLSGIGSLSVNLLQATRSQRHLHLLPLARTPVLQYCVHLVLAALQQQFISQPPGLELDMCVGHMLVLIQLELGVSEHPLCGAVDLLVKLLGHIRSRPTFSYPIFTHYIINAEILEEVMHLATKASGSITFEISPPSTSQLANQRRISTRGVDKGAKEDFKSAMRRQMTRSSEPLEPILVKFLTTEQDSIRRLLWPPNKSFIRL